VKAATIARNYAEALFQAAEAHATATVEQYGALLDDLAGAIAADHRIGIALDSPRVAKATKARMLAASLRGVAPPEFIRFLQAVVYRGRQGLLAEIGRQYETLLDAKLNRVHAGITLARNADPRLEEQVVARLRTALGRDVRAHFRTDGSILGGIVVRVGDRVFDGSLRRKVAVLRRQLLGAG
jgi:F-type H+-transporting ATPase subunit delta